MNNGEFNSNPANSEGLSENNPYTDNVNSAQPADFMAKYDAEAAAQFEAISKDSNLQNDFGVKPEDISPAVDFVNTNADYYNTAEAPAPDGNIAVDSDLNGSSDNGAAVPPETTEKKKKTGMILTIVFAVIAVVLAIILGLTVHELNSTKAVVDEQQLTLDACEDYMTLQGIENDALRYGVKSTYNAYAKAKQRADANDASKRAAQAIAMNAEDRAKAAESAQDSQAKAISEAISTNATKNTAKIANYPGEDTGTLTPSRYITLYKGHIESYYSSRNYKHVYLSKFKLNPNGIYTDPSGFIVVAANKGQLKYRSFVFTSNGVGRVYDFGAAEGCLDIYTNW